MALKEYSVTAPDGTPLSFTGPEGASPEEIRAAAERAYAATKSNMAASEGALTAPQGRPAEVGTRNAYRPISPVSNYMRPGALGTPEPDAASKIVEGMSRHGIPIGAGLLTGGTSIPVTSAVGGISSLIGNTLAQKSRIGRGAQEGFDRGEMMSDTVLGLTPFLAKKGTLTRIGVNTASSLGAQELASLASGEGHISPTEALMGVVFTGGLSTLGGASSGVVNKAAKAKELSQSRYGGTVALSEIFPSKIKLEGRVISTGGLADRIVEGMDSGMATKIIQDYADVNQNPEVIKEMASLIGVLDPIQRQVDKAKRAASAASAAYQNAIRTQSEKINEFKLKAEQAASNVALAKLSRAGMVNSMLKGVGPDLAGISKGARKARLSEVATTTREAAKTGMGRLWQDVGIGINAKQVIGSDLMSSIKNIRRGPLAGQNAKKSFREAAQKMLGNKNALTREDYMDFRDKFAKQLANEGADPNKANAIASKAYDVLKKSATKYVKNNLSESQQDAWRKFNSLSSKYFSARGADAMKLVANGDADGLVRAMKEGAGPMLDEINAYEKSIRGVAGKDAANMFRSDIDGLIRDGVIDSAVRRGVGLSGAEAIDPKKLIESVDSLRSSGFPINRLGLGSNDQVRALARIADSKNLSKDEMFAIMRDIPDVGFNAAVARNDYYNDLRKELISGGAKSRGNTTARLAATRKAAKLSVDEANEMLQKASSDPVVEMLSGSTMKLSKNPVNNIKYAATLLNTDGDTTSRVAKALIDSGRTRELQELRKAAVAGEMLSMFEESAFSTPRVKVESLAGLLGEAIGSKGKRDALIGLIGDDGFAQLKKNFLSPLQQVLTSRKNLAQGNPTLLDAFGGTVRARGSGNVGLYARVQPILDFVNNKQYNTFYMLAVDPVTSKQFAKAGYDINRYVASNPVNATFYKLLQDKDAEANAAP
jgi:hypothetical protein